MKRAQTMLALGLALAGMSCEQGAAPPTPSSGDLQQGVVARVGEDTISTSTVARIMESQGLSAKDALDAAIYDALLAAGAPDIAGERGAALDETQVLAHALIRSMWLEAQRDPISEKELAEVTNVRWTRYDRPVGRRVLHVVALLPRGTKPTEDDLANAEAVAEKMRQALAELPQRARETSRPERDGETMFLHAENKDDPVKADFEAAVKTVDNGMVGVKVELLPPITPDGYPIEHGIAPNAMPYDPDFSAGVAKLEQRGDLSGVVRSHHGFHVILLLEVTPAYRAPRAERLVALRKELIEVRMRRRQRKLLAKLRTNTAVDVVVKHDALLEQVKLER